MAIPFASIINRLDFYTMNCESKQPHDLAQRFVKFASRFGIGRVYHKTLRIDGTYFGEERKDRGHSSKMRTFNKIQKSPFANAATYAAINEVAAAIFYFFFVLRFPPSTRQNGATLHTVFTHPVIDRVDL